MVLTLLAASALASPAATGDALDRLGEVLALRIDDGQLSRDDIVPAILVSLEPRYQVSENWFSTRAIEVLGTAFGTNGLRVCEACMSPRTDVEDGRLTYTSGPAGLDEIVRFDDDTRGPAEPAKTAIWLDENRGGVSLRIVDLRTGRVIFAQNVDPNLSENANSERMSTLAEELERRARGDSLTQTFADFALYPKQHISVDITDQWGKTNANLSGVTLSVLDPVIGIGGVDYRRIPIDNILVGGQVVVSLPTALAASLSDNSLDVLDPLVTVVGVVRVPFGRSNYGVVGTFSTNGALGVGISLMNIRLLPVLL